VCMFCRRTTVVSLRTTRVSHALILRQGKETAELTIHTAALPYDCGPSLSCIHIGKVRRCCLGRTTDCASSMFPTTCIPSSSLTASGATAEPCRDPNTMCW